MKKLLHSRKGFTLIEILVVMFVTVILSASLITYNSRSRLQIALMVEKAKIVQQILRAKSLSVTTQRGTGAAGAACGYGWHIDYARREYAIFKYGNPGGFFGGSSAPDCTAIDPYFVSTNRNNPIIIVERSEADPNLIFEVDTTSLLDVVFVPPDPQVVLLIAGDSVDPADPPATATTTINPGTIIIKTRDGRARATITVTKTGLVTF